MKPYYDKGGIVIWCGNCLEVMPRLEPPFAAIIADWPYGTTACSWDSVIPLEPLWKECKRLSDTAVLFGSQPFTSALVMSNVRQFKYCWTWDKMHPRGHLVANIRPMQATEDIAIFGHGRIYYNPQKTKRKIPLFSKEGSRTAIMGGVQKDDYKGKMIHDRHPTTILQFKSVTNGLHPTQKPEPLMANLIRTYTNPGDIILDNTMGSGTTLVAAQNEGRRAVGIELSEEYCRIAVDRLRQPSFWSIREKQAPKKPRQVELGEMIKRGLE